MISHLLRGLLFLKMAKRFIDTGLFDDPWFMDLSKDAKMLWVYLITKCDHAGLIDLNNKLCEFQTGIKSIETVIKELGNRIVSVREQLYFIPKFIQFQYPNFPNSKAKAQNSAIELLTKNKLFLNGSITIPELLPNSYGNDNDNGNDKDDDTNSIPFFEKFWDSYHFITGMEKTDKEPALKYWKKLTQTEKQKAFDMINAYNNSISDKKYIKKARTYLADKNFNDEYSVNKKSVTTSGAKPTGAFIPNPEWVEDR